MLPASRRSQLKSNTPSFFRGGFSQHLRPVRKVTTQRVSLGAPLFGCLFVCLLVCLLVWLVVRWVVCLCLSFLPPFFLPSPLPFMHLFIHAIFDSLFVLVLLQRGNQRFAPLNFANMFSFETVQLCGAKKKPAGTCILLKPCQAKNYIDLT